MVEKSSVVEQGSGYRADIQGLRAIAVLLVITFHAGLPVVGGFLGVDVFFVISGFVITSMLLREWHTYGRIRLATFWRRRFFRLTPALALTVFVVFILAALILLPLQQQVAYQTGLGALFFVANIVIARNTGGYFDAPAERNPLLNTWSLSVEEQFYLLFPLLLAGALVIWRRNRRLSWMPTAMVALTALLSICCMLWALSPSGAGITWLNFYSPITRTWEFAVGSLLATITFGRRPVGQRLGLLWRVAGGAGLLFTAFAIDGSTPFPSLWTFVPVLATVALLIGGASQSGGRHRILELPVLVKIGDWSYSLYLWHWPFIVFAIALGFEAPVWVFLAALASFLPAISSYKFAETPLRRWSPEKPIRRVGAALAIVGIPVLLVPFLTNVATPSPRFDGTVGVSYLEEIWETSFPCDLLQEPNTGSRCLQSQKDTPLTVVAIGDSHAEDLYLGLRANLPDSNVGYVYLPGWPYDTSTNTASTFQQIADSQTIDTVIINARWDDGGAESDELATQLDILQNANKTTFLADDRPRFSFPAERCQYQPWVGPRAQCAESSSPYFSTYREYLALLTKAATVRDNVHLLNTSDGICDDQVCSMVNDGSLFFADEGHLNEIGSEWVIAQRITSDPVFRDSVGRK